LWHPAISTDFPPFSAQMWSGQWPVARKSMAWQLCKADVVVLPTTAALLPWCLLNLLLNHHVSAPSLSLTAPWINHVYFSVSPQAAVLPGLPGLYILQLPTVLTKLWFHPSCKRCLKSLILASDSVMDTHGAPNSVVPHAHISPFREGPFTLGLTPGCKCWSDLSLVISVT
jgi:hypothetical protein